MAARKGERSEGRKFRPVRSMPASQPVFLDSRLKRV